MQGQSPFSLFGLGQRSAAQPPAQPPVQPPAQAYGPQQDSLYDMHMSMCIEDKVEQMATPERCVAYMATSVYNRSRDNPQLLNTRVEDLRSFCEDFTNQQTVGFYKELCQGVNQAYRNAMQK